MKLFNFKKRVIQPEVTKDEVAVMEIPVKEDNVKIIDSKAIQEDIKLSFDKVLEEFNLDPSKESQVDNLNNKLEEFKDSNKEVYNKIERLKGLGLTNTPSITKSLEQLKKDEDKIQTKISNIEDELKKSKELQDLISQYYIQYPGYKFISDSVMIGIMKKYDLVLGDAFMYSKEIPDKSLDIISNFTKEIKESETKLYFVEETNRGNVWSNNNYKKFMTETPKSSEYFAYHILRTFSISKFKMIAPLSHFNIPTTSYDSGRRMQNYEETTISLFKLDLNTRKFIPNASELEEANKKLREVLDPIACLEVKGGYIIMDAWDKEAEISEIKNVNLN